jgi:GTP diphosphokinase / guanosine-3',5'-bis(diphosphate) 3'-diphosphatase
MLSRIFNQIDPSQIKNKTLEYNAKYLWEILLKNLNYLDRESVELIELAFLQMTQSHSEQKRKSGDYYIIHPVSAALVLANLNLDPYTISACLLHDVPEDTETTLENLSKSFNSEIIFLIEGVTKLSNLRYKGEERYAENLRKMFVAMSKDLRVIFIKLADRLHNLTTLEYLPQAKQRRIALESLEIYAPIAERLGISKLQHDLEEIAFKYVYPDIYYNFTIDAKVEVERRNLQLEYIIRKTKEVLDRENVPYEKIYGRAKKYYSVYRKIQDRDKDLEDLYDLVAVRVITKNIEDCYLVLSILKNNFVEVPNRYKDYVSNPKKNGYQSIHLNAFIYPQELPDLDQKTSIPFEFQIRTNEMHDFAEYGVAAHFIYKSQTKKSQITEFIKGENLKWVKELVELGQQSLSESDYIQKVKLDLFNDRIFVFTPKNDVIDMPLGSTCLDFAYRIHEDIGNTASVALVNGKSSKLSHELNSGDSISIITDRRRFPAPDWLNSVITRHARNCIKNYLKKQI